MSQQASDIQNDFVHCEQLQSFEPVWALKYLCKTLDWTSDFVYWQQLYGFILVRTLKCLFGSLDMPHDWEHSEQLYIFSTVRTTEIANLSTECICRVSYQCELQMNLQGTWLGKWLNRLTVAVRLLTSRNSWMFLKMTLQGTGFVQWQQL